MKGYIFVSPGSDPGAGRRLDDPILTGRRATMGTCRPDLRRFLQKGDHLFVISGRTRGVEQYVIGGFQVDDKIDQMKAYNAFPENRLNFDKDGRIGNIVVDALGKHDVRDHHDKIDKRIQNYLIGSNVIQLATPHEVQIARERSLAIMQEIFDRPHARRISEAVGRHRSMNERQVENLLTALQSLKAEAYRESPHR